MQVTLPAGKQYVMIAIPFDAVQGTDGLSLADIFGEDPLAKGFTGGGNKNGSDQLQFWYINAYGTGTYKNLWLNGNSIALPLYKKWINDGNTGWGTANQPTTKRFMGGESFWIKRYVAPTVVKSNPEEMAAALPEINLTVAGAVIVRTEGKVEWEINPASTDAPEYTMISSAFTAPFIPNPDKVDPSKAKIDWFSYGCVGGGNKNTSDQIQIWDVEKQTYKYLWLNGNSIAAPLYGWWINDGNTGWGTANQPTTVQIDPRIGFWYRRVKGATGPCKIPMPQPYSL